MVEQHQAQRRGRVLGGVRPTGEDHRATTFELFFDLVYVFAVTQVTGYMTHEHSGFGVLPCRAGRLGAHHGRSDRHRDHSVCADPTQPPRRIAILTCGNGAPRWARTPTARSVARRESSVGTPLRHCGEAHWQPHFRALSGPRGCHRRRLRQGGSPIGVQVIGQVLEAAVDLDGDDPMVGAQAAGELERRDEVGAGRWARPEKIPSVRAAWRAMAKASASGTAMTSSKSSGPSIGGRRPMPPPSMWWVPGVLPDRTADSSGFTTTRCSASSLTASARGCCQGSSPPSPRSCRTRRWPVDRAAARAAPRRWPDTLRPCRDC
jgi:hypothetical protein